MHRPAADERDDDARERNARDHDARARADWTSR
jgi:hypothetical protein